MKLNLGTNLRQLRREHNLTQEDLAEVLKVSCQSVSRWEKGICYPDIELLPVIAAFFHTTVEQLLGVSQAIEEQKVSAYLEQFQSAISVGDINACIEIARKGVAEFPSSFALRNKLMYALFVSADKDGNIPNWEDNKYRYDAEIVSLGESIMKFCPDQEIRLEATTRLGFHHCEMGRQAKGRAIFETLPSSQYCKENWIWRSLENEEELPHIRQQIAQGYATMRAGIFNLVDDRLLPDEQLIQVYEKIFALDQLLIDGYAMDAQYYHARSRCGMAAVYSRLGENQQALTQLTIAADAARTFDHRPKEQNTACLLLGNRTWRREEFETSDARMCCEIMAQKWLQESDFDSIRSTPDFQKIIRMLEDSAYQEDTYDET
jgi:transcriptional regulator with XRE-family HTH domain